MRKDLMPQSAILLLAIMLWPTWLAGATFNIQDHGATPDDDTDDTAAIQAALDACAEAGGGIVFVPSGTYMIARQSNEPAILTLGSNTILEGEGTVSTLKFVPQVNESNFWRMIGAKRGLVEHITIRDLRLDGSTTHTEYAGKYEQNHGIFFYNKQEGEGVRHVTIENILAENFSGDCIAVSQGSQNVTIRNVALRNYLRQGVQMGGGNEARDYLVTGVQGLPSDVKGAGSTLHIEHARGLKNVILANNHCTRSLLAGGVDGLVIRGNVVEGRIWGNRNRNLVVAGNVVRSRPNQEPGGRPMIFLGYTRQALVTGNTVESDVPERNGLYIWGNHKSPDNVPRDIVVANNIVRVQGTGIDFNNVESGRIFGNQVIVPEGERSVVLRRSDNVRTDQATPQN